MLSKDHFREHASGVHGLAPERHSRWGDVLLTAILIAALLGVYLLAAHSDARSDQRWQAAAELERQRLASPPQVMRAYEAGLSDAVQAMRHTPEGVELAQLCLAMRGGL